ncbi:DNA ligase [Candidatus Methanoplasma termitum]|uniref:DNA ligase n=1 Tax=Candidatus Methanoplasma termitum TaxID=1577791 RepID=A0A0A7LCC3_9ARCH|nr:ATP-dependent DNA ligase [Candidatus Methanoplasma termitum]AIZ56618.1 DNA ligase [Candidatus Methanoplasma termitum]MCL2334097.1 ATP-dependent DNA ligase [Candidatus Methanoplasma sp.]
MLYSDIADVFDRLEGTSSRLEMTSIFSDFFKGLDPGSLRKIVYLSQGRLHPDFYNAELGMADKLVLRAISFTAGVSESKMDELWKKEGDPGKIAETLMKNRKQASLFSEPLTLEKVLKNLTMIESAEGRDSQDKKMKLLSNLLMDSNPVEARYLCRIVTGRMRIGAGSMTILDALAEAFGTKEDRPDIERGFNITCDLGFVAETLAIGGVEAVKKMKVTVGNPIKVMLAERLPSISLIMDRMGGRCAMEFKYDGIRVQAHIDRDSVKLYSRRLEDMTSNFPDIAAELRKQCRAERAIIEGECVAIDKDGNMLPFQNVTHRRKKHGMDQAVEDYPVKIFMFDILSVDDEDMTLRPLGERRSKLNETFGLSDMIQLTTMEVVNSPEEGEDFFNRALGKKCEGIMAKSLSQESVYRAGSRGFLWIKYKKDYEEALTDSFDLVVVGAFHGRGKRAGKYGALLMAAFDDESGKYCTVCKLGTGFDDAFLAGMPDMLDEYLSETHPSTVDAEMIPDVWFLPTVILEVVAAEISLSPIHTAAKSIMKDNAGLGLRFPRFTGRVREDKGPEECTTVNEIISMFEMQAQNKA